MEKQTLIDHLVGQREVLLQAWWAHRLWGATPLQTVDGRMVEVIFPGWLNKGPGPDFTEARVTVAGDELFGDVEIHMEESGWRNHGHHRDPAYERVMLHVVLRQSSEAIHPAHAVGKSIPVLEALPHLPPGLTEAMGEPEGMLARYDALPGRCGLRTAVAPPEALPRVIAHAAEARARNKAERLAPLWNGHSEEQILFQLIFQSLGYRPYAEAFQSVAARFPLAELAPFFALPAAQCRMEVLARWLGALGLLEREPKAEDDPEGALEYEQLRNHWQQLGAPLLRIPLRKGGSRPWNAPERRVIGAYHHLRALTPGSLLKGWLAFLYELDGLRDRPELRKRALKLLETIFATPEEETWRYRVSFSGAKMKTAARLVGTDRVVIVMANAVLPFFLGYARRRKDAELEKLLYRLFIVLPPEAPNHRTRFMEKRLIAVTGPPRTLRFHQGLLQIHQDFCRSFSEGCESCGFPDLIWKG